MESVRTVSLLDKQILCHSVQNFVLRSSKVTGKWASALTWKLSCWVGFAVSLKRSSSVATRCCWQSWLLPTQCSGRHLSCLAALQKPSQCSVPPPDPSSQPHWRCQSGGPCDRCCPCSPATLALAVLAPLPRTHRAWELLPAAFCAVPAAAAAEDALLNGLVGLWAVLACDSKVMKAEVQVVLSVLFLCISGSQGIYLDPVRH